jgi:hypothetical protein
MAMDDRYGVDMGDPDPNTPFAWGVVIIVLCIIFW